MPARHQVSQAGGGGSPTTAAATAGKNKKRVAGAGGITRELRKDGSSGWKYVSVRVNGRHFVLQCRSGIARCVWGVIVVVRGEDGSCDGRDGSSSGDTGGGEQKRVEMSGARETFG